jgi:hypothetical protein
MISLKKCREILGEKGKLLSDEQIESVRELLISMARINVKIIKEHNTQKKADDEESNDNE